MFVHLEIEFLPPAGLPGEKTGLSVKPGESSGNPWGSARRLQSVGRSEGEKGFVGRLAVLETAGDQPELLIWQGLAAGRILRFLTFSSHMAGIGNKPAVPAL